MTLDDVARLLGKDSVEGVEDAVRAAIEAGEHLDHATASRAVRELLLTMLSAVIITPLDGADKRVEHDVRRLEAIVEAALHTHRS